MKSVREIPHFDGVPILVRAALNEPVEGGIVQDTFRLSRAKATLEFLQSKGACVVVVSHIGEAGTETLKPVADVLAKMLPRVSFCQTTIGPAARDVARGLLPGEIVVMENLRRDAREIANDPEFAKELAHLADYFVQDSFDTCHREHASIVGVPKLLPSYAGLVLEQEVRELTKALSPASPSLAVIGGAKFSTKKPVLMALLKKYDKVFVGGALASDFLKSEGYNVGQSLTSDADAEQMKALLANKKLVLPVDSLVVDAADPRREAARVAALDDVKENETILDHGPGTVVLLEELVKKSKTILWNGPLGHYESGFVDATDAFARAIASSDIYSVIGGGDTITAIEKLNIMDRISFVSTGGGAMLDFLASGTLPGITALG